MPRPTPEVLLDQLGGQLASGEVVLFTGAGFSADARARDGEALPSTAELTRQLWAVAFPDHEPDGSQLEDVYECALAADPQRTADVLCARLQVDDRSLPDTFQTWFSMPWFRVYTLNVDDVDEAAQRRFDLPVAVRPVSALTDELPPRCPDLLSVHLNGRIADFPAITFSHAQYGQRTALPDPWYQHLAADLSAHPVLFVGTQVDEPPFWQQLALRLWESDARRARPPSYLVTPRLPLARRRVLHQLQIEWVPMRQADFARDVLAQLGPHAEQGHERLRAAAGWGTVIERHVDQVGAPLRDESRVRSRRGRGARVGPDTRAAES